MKGQHGCAASAKKYYARGFFEMVSFTMSNQTAFTSQAGLRPVNLRTDLAPLADLIELVFADSMDSNGRAALREMRMLSKIGAGLNLLSRMNDAALGIHLGYVWIQDGGLVGNVSIYPARWPRGLGSAWIIANVGVHPDYQRRGIARRLMLASLDLIRARGGQHAILQVDHHNYRAHDLYETLGFVDERAWSTWRRSSAPRTTTPLHALYAQIGYRRPPEWRAEYALARQSRPEAQGGLGWLRPLHTSYFRPNPLKWLNDLVNFRQMERLALRHPDTEALEAVLWVEGGLGAARRLTLMVDPLIDDYQARADALLNTVVRRYGGEMLTIEHPYDDEIVNDLLQTYRFVRQRSVIHMRWDAHTQGVTTN
jgi:GNAT superfamily N-acetyltransferase